MVIINNGKSTIEFLQQHKYYIRKQKVENKLGLGQITGLKD